jgi:hypothetical protein
MAKSGQNSVAAGASSKRDVTKVSAEELPRKTLAEAVRVVDALYRNYPEGATWEEIAKLLEVSANNPNNKYPLWSAVAYGLLSRREDNRYDVSEAGRKIVAPEFAGEDAEGKVKALLTPRILSKFFTDYNGRPLPEIQHFPNVLENRYKVPRDRTSEAINLILENGHYAGVLSKRDDGSAIVHLDTPSSASTRVQDEFSNDGKAVDVEDTSTGNMYDWEKTCFFITPIGEDGTEQRRHADMMLKHVLEPVAKEYGLQVVRADKIERSGLITQQIFEQLAKAKICVADLSFSNANVFYELGVRHTCKLPTVQLIRKGDKIPFDVAQGRTIVVGTSDIYSIVDRLASAQRELGQHVGHIMSATTKEPGEENPVHLYLPKLRVTHS